MKKFITIVWILVFISSSVPAQIEKVIVETYYISDTIDATDTFGGGLETGSITYRIYIDLSSGNKLKKIYGDEYHPLIISSTEKFFNNADRGEIFGYDIRNNRLDENTVALDSWITIGFATDEYLGILKEEDTDGSIVGGVNNDGGSALIAGGLLVNTDPAAGIPLTTADGLVQNTQNLNNFTSIGFTEISIFGQSLQPTFTGTSNFLSAQTGVVGPTTDNLILVAQLTTKGELSFKLNIEVEVQEGVFIKYVSGDTLLQEGEEYSNWLSYPTSCGCTDPYFIQYDPAGVCDDGSCKDSVPCGCKDPYFLEYDPDEFCHDQSECKDSIILGCMDIYACNYDPDANFSVRELCCYPPDNCDDRDISVVCPEWEGNKKSAIPNLIVYPNPVTDILTLEISLPQNTYTGYTIYDAFGNTILKKNLGRIENIYTEQIDLSDISKGMYLIRLTTGLNPITQVFIKD
jgi:hypothetical protein